MNDRYIEIIIFCVRQTLLHDPNSMLARMFDPVSPLCPGNLDEEEWLRSIRDFIGSALCPLLWTEIEEKNCHSLSLLTKNTVLGAILKIFLVC